MSTVNAVFRLTTRRNLCISRGLTSNYFHFSRKMTTTTSEVFKDLIRHHNSIFILDGGTGEELFARGVPDDRKIWSATAIVHEKYHEVLKQVHRSFLVAGSDTITTNSYGIIPGVGFSCEEIEYYCAIAGRLAKESVQQYNIEINQSEGIEAKNRPPLVLGSLGPLVESYRADKIMERQEGVRFYHSMITALSKYVDAFIAETLSSTEEAMQVIDALSNFNLNANHSIPLLVSFTVDSEGKLRIGEMPDSALLRLTSYIQESKSVILLSFLFNCSDPESISQSLRIVNSNSILMSILNKSSIVLGAYANRLTPVAKDWTLAGSEGPQPSRQDLDPTHYCEDFARSWVQDLNVKVIGGCCGITPAHISMLKRQWA